ncbi:chromosome partition protein Smc [Acrocarpospora phusangensis]|uniref:Chromosome partition protein Smc n=1 Tax=Acrocarpospora phusangensis TaxID=1070424 RepID=A0A919QDR2_9ACTN|nr:AAA family ATPase [Acrocarpospora phusangensis]GIH26996.1 chromosome partition protein Smc [Acrocarpospora phusangensis]
MYLKTLTLRGFKSFASATALRFEPGITCVVGPNGSGKSNVVDALAWVMGEHSAKSLRGGKMEDVIFAGTSSRPPLGRAEVTLTIDNSDGALPIDYTEVTISRLMFRSGQSEYAINGDTCRLLDIQELLSDSGIGREMHVIVGQGQLDQVLHAGPEERRAFIEEAAGVLKHRKRKEKALRKLDAMQANLTRVQDLATELRRQLKPLGRQAEIARKAAVIQADLRDARLRLLADDVVTLRDTLQREAEDEAAVQARRAQVEREHAEGQEREAALEGAANEAQPRLTAAQETFYRLSALRERLRGVESLAAERERNAADAASIERRGRDPEEFEREAAEVREQERELQEALAEAQERLAVAVESRGEAEESLAAEERRLAALARAAADRREALARLRGQVDSARSRARAAEEEIGRLAKALDDARERAEQAQADHDAQELSEPATDAGLAAELASAEEGVALARAQVEAAREIVEQAKALVEEAKSAVAAPRAALAAASSQVGTARAADQDAQRALSALTARRDALELSLSGDGELEWVTGELPGPPRPVLLAKDVATAERLSSERPDLAAVLGPGAVFGALTGTGSADNSTWQVRAALEQAVGDLRAAAVTAEENAEILAEAIQAEGAAREAVEAAQARVSEAQTGVTVAQNGVNSARGGLDAAQAALDRVRGRQRAADQRLADAAKQLARLEAAVKAARDEGERLAAAVQGAEEAREVARAGIAELEERLAEEEYAGELEAEPTTELRDELAAACGVTRQVEMEARLTVRTAEERVRGIAGRADGLLRAARREREDRARAAAQRERRRVQAKVAASVVKGAQTALRALETSLTRAATERDEAETVREAVDAELKTVRLRVRELGTELDKLVNRVHGSEVARTEQRLRLEQLQERAMEEYGVETDALIAEYGPTAEVPGDPPIPYVRAEQEKRARAADKQMAQLGKVNPLALEEFAALEERHTFLTSQLEDLKKTRRDLLLVVKEVDDRVEQVFSAAYDDVQREFSQIFERVFPGGEGRLLLTDPSDMLTTGVEVEARPPGKKVKRLSLLSGGERSLTAVAFLISIFKARPSPFYVMDEVEAALDDTNTQRLLTLFEELRQSSQLIVITHQKRTMEIADALYGVSMRGDGVTQVVSQRLREHA